jgi:hypothetical protein
MNGLCLLAVLFSSMDQARGTTPAARSMWPARLVTTEKELEIAAQATARTDLTILIDRPIEIRRQISFPESRSVVRIIGVSNRAGLHLNMVFRGDVSRIEDASSNGLQIASRQAVIANLDIHGFEMQGSAIKGDTRELLSVVNCTFQDIGTRTYPFRGQRARNSTDAVYTQCVGAHQLWDCHIEVIGCKFERCTSNTWQWSHCLYLSARSILVADNEFTECGNPISLGGGGRPNSIQVVNNRFLSPRSGRTSDGRDLSAFLSSVDAKDTFVFMHNTVSGTWISGWTGSPNPENHVIDYNDYGGAVYDGPAWAANTTTPQYISWEQWREMGFDGHSTAPVWKLAPSPPRP